jgi:cellulose synthase (UDP-forming)
MDSDMKKPYMHIPKHPTASEKHRYVAHGQRLLTALSVISFAGVVYSSTLFFTSQPFLYIFIPFLLLFIAAFVTATVSTGLNRPFDINAHKKLVRAWHPKKYPSVDVFLPVVNEHINILRNTWKGVAAVIKHYQGPVTVYVLDDGALRSTHDMAKEFGFKYLVRDNRGHFKKAGNLQYGFYKSDSKFITIFDADFKPRPDFLNELLPYFDQDKKLGIIQSPQYFDVHRKQNWIERGAGAVQEYFYRSIQQNRDSYDGAICVGSNAVYRRVALAANGGTTLIEHSEDVHTGFDLRKLGWGLKYLPVVLAKGVSPNDLHSFFKQQYRWCMGTMSLLGSKKFWATKMPTISRICYIAGFLYYILTAVLSIIVLIIPLTMIFLVPQYALLINFLPIVPALLYNVVVFPLWHRSHYGPEVLSIKQVFGWAHVFAITDSLEHKSMEWIPTGATSHAKSGHYLTFQICTVIFGVGGGLVWTIGGIVQMFNWDFWGFTPIVAAGLVYLAINLRIASAFRT